MDAVTPKAKNQSLPSWTYTSEAYFELECRKVVLPSWQMVCHLNNIPDAGDYYTFDILNERAFVIRGADGNVHAFHNVCRHRAARLLDGPNGNAGKSIVCPYHTWAYDLGGDLTRVPYEEEFEGFERACHNLTPVELEVYMGFVFIRFEGDGPSVAEQFAPYEDELRHYRLDELQPLGRITMRPRTVNWKNIADNYVDALHIGPAHPGLTGLLGNTYAIEARGDVHKMSGDVVASRKDTLSTRAYKEILPEVDWLPEDRQKHWTYYRLWPNLALDIYPDQVDFMQFIPISATETMIRELPYAIPDDRREMKLARYLNWRINRQVNAEDTDLVNRVQDGMGSSSFTSGPFANREVLLIASANRIREQVPIAESETKPKERVLREMLEDA